MMIKTFIACESRDSPNGDSTFNTWKEAFVHGINTMQYQIAEFHDGVFAMWHEIPYQFRMDRDVMA